MANKSSHQKNQKISLESHLDQVAITPGALWYSDQETLHAFIVPKDQGIWMSAFENGVLQLDFFVEVHECGMFNAGRDLKKGSGLLWDAIHNASTLHKNDKTCRVWESWTELLMALSLQGSGPIESASNH